MCWHGGKHDRRKDLKAAYDIEEYQTEESCLSLEGVRPCTRYKEIEVDYLDQDFKPQHGKYKDFTAQVIQHEIDHFEGVLI